VNLEKKTGKNVWGGEKKNVSRGRYGNKRFFFSLMPKKKIFGVKNIFKMKNTQI